MKYTSDDGFTLLEVLVSVAIIALTFVVLLTTHSQSLDFMYTSTRMSTATLLARQIIEKAEIAGFPDTGSDSGSFEEEAYRDLRWEKIVTDSPLERLRQIEVKVFWTVGTKDKSVTLVSFIAEK